MKRLSLNRNGTKNGGNSGQQQKISSFFSSKNPVFRTPEVSAAKKRDHEDTDHHDKDVVEGTPESETKKRRLFKMKKRSSKLSLFMASTTSLISGNLDKKATKVHSPPRDVENVAPPKQLALINFEPASEDHKSTPTTSSTKSLFTKIKSPNKVVPSPTQIIIDDEHDEEKISPKKSPPKPAQHQRTHMSKDSLCASFGRHRVKSVEEIPGEIQLKIEDVFNDGEKECVLRGSWADTKLKCGDIINILCVDKDAEKIVINDLNGLVVVNPDILVSGTSIVSTLFCMRKAVLNERFKGQDSRSRTMLIGTLVHELLQDSLRMDLRTFDQIQRQLESCLSKPEILKSLLALGMTQVEMKKEVTPFLTHIQYFTDKYVLGKNVVVPEPAFSVSSRDGKPQTWPGKVQAIRDIEENIWSPRLGIKGKVDLTIQVRKANDTESKILPLELKTGRPSGSAEHRGQVILYSMMMSERRPDPEAGLLLYLRNSSLLEVKAGIHEMRGLVQLRNGLASHIIDDLEVIDKNIGNFKSTFISNRAGRNEYMY